MKVFAHCMAVKVDGSLVAAASHGEGASFPAVGMGPPPLGEVGSSAEELPAVGTWLGLSAELVVSGASCALVNET